MLKNILGDDNPPLATLSTVSVAVIGQAGRSKRAAYAALSVSPPGDLQSLSRLRSRSAQSPGPRTPCLIKLNRSSRFIEHLGNGYDDVTLGGEKDALLMSRAEGEGGGLMDLDRFSAEVGVTAIFVELQLAVFLTLSFSTSFPPSTRPCPTSSARSARSTRSTPSSYPDQPPAPTPQSPRLLSKHLLRPLPSLPRCFPRCQQLSKLSPGARRTWPAARAAHMSRAESRARCGSGWPRQGGDWRRSWTRFVRVWQGRRRVRRSRGCGWRRGSGEERVGRQRREWGKA